MKLFIQNNKVYINELCEKDTVLELLNAITALRISNPDICSTYESNFCNSRQSILGDAVFVKANVGTNEGNIKRYIQSKLALTHGNQIVLYSKGKCIFCDGANRCLIQDTRPLSCRLSVFGSMQKELSILIDMITLTYCGALVYEYIQCMDKNLFAKSEDFYRDNPVLFHTNYRAKIFDIVKYAERMQVVNEEELSKIKNIIR